MDVLLLKDTELRSCSYQEIVGIVEEISQFVVKQHHVDSIELSKIIPLLEQSDELFGKIAIIQEKVSHDEFEDLPEDWKTKKENLLNKLYSTQTAVQTIRDSYRIWIAVTDFNDRFADLEKKYQALTKDYERKKQSLEADIAGLQKATQVKLNSQTQKLEETEKQLGEHTKGLQEAQKQLSEQTKGLQGAKQQLEEQTKGLQEAKIQFDVKTQEVDQAISTTLEEIRGEEGKILSHVLTLMGVFTAVITVILSVASTSSSWLNSATSSSAIIAFAVPNLVTLFAVVSLVLLIYIYHKAFYPPLLKREEKHSLVPDFISALLLLFILGATILLSVIAYRYADIDSKPHKRYIIENGQYKVRETQDEATNEVCKYFEFNLEGFSYQFSYDRDYLHDSSLYYCTEHNTLE